MTLDFLGTDDTNHIVAEEVSLIDTSIILKRGFFFMDSIELYDASGNLIDKNGYNFDLPNPAVSATTGKMIFGRILMTTAIVPVSIDYRTPYFESDNRNEAIASHALATDVTGYYYNHASNIFRENINLKDDASISTWMNVLKSLSTAWGESIIDNETILDAVDEVFTLGIIRNPVIEDVSALNNSTYIDSSNSSDNSSITLATFKIEWKCPTGSGIIDYTTNWAEIATYVNRINSTLDGTYTGELDDIMANLEGWESTIEKTPLMTIDLTSSTKDIGIVNGKVVIAGLILPDHYTTLDTSLDTLNSYTTRINKMSWDLSNSDISEVYAMVQTFIPALNSGYKSTDIVLIDESVWIDGKNADVSYTVESLMEEVKELGISGEVVTSELMYSLEDATALHDTLSANVIKVTSSFTTLGTNIPAILDGLCVTKSKLGHTMGDSFDLGEVS